MLKSLMMVPVAVLLIAGTSWADKSSADYGRPGWYGGVGGGAGIDFLSDAVQDETGGNVELSVGSSFNARGGYRVASWFAFEPMYEGVYGTTVTVSGTKAADQDTHSFVGNFKLIVPSWRFQPYIMAGPGAQYGKFNGRGPFDFLDTSRWDFVLRTALGIDMYLTQHWLLDVEFAPSIRFADYGDIPSEVTDNVTLTFSFGVQYRH